MKNGPLNFSAIALQLKCYGKAKALADGKRLHKLISTYGYDSDTFLGNWLIQMYGDCGSPKAAQEAFDNITYPNLYSWNILINAHGQNGNLQAARNVFMRMPCRDVVSWNALITAYAQHGDGREALDFFFQMQVEGIRPTCISYVSALNAAAGIAALKEGEEIFAAIAGSEHWNNVVVGNALIDMYGKCNHMCEAQTVFDKMPRQNAVSWTTMIAAYTQSKQAEKALKLFGEMVPQGFEPESITFGCVIDACTGISALAEGQDVHAAAICCGHEQDVMVGSALVNLYAKFGSLDDAMNSFCKISTHNVVSWTSMIAGYAHNEYFQEALDLFHWMMVEGVKPDRVTFVCVMEVCASLGALENGKEIHYTIIDNGCEKVLEVGNALIDMYGKCGSLHNAKHVFDRMPLHDVVSWNAMIASSAHNGNGKEALTHFWQMQHSGIEPNGLLDDAEAFIYTIPFEKASAAWLCLLSACRLHGDVERGVRLARFCFELDRTNVAPYKMLSNIHAALS